MFILISGIYLFDLATVEGFYLFKFIISVICAALLTFL